MQKRFIIAALTTAASLAIGAQTASAQDIACERGQFQLINSCTVTVFAPKSNPTQNKKDSNQKARSQLKTHLASLDQKYRFKGSRFLSRKAEGNQVKSVIKFPIQSLGITKQAAIQKTANGQMHCISFEKGKVHSCFLRGNRVAKNKWHEPSMRRAAGRKFRDKLGQFPAGYAVKGIQKYAQIDENVPTAPGNPQQRTGVYQAFISK